MGTLDSDIKPMGVLLLLEPKQLANHIQDSFCEEVSPCLSEEGKMKQYIAY
jgi:hypothetical protein